MKLTIAYLHDISRKIHVFNCQRLMKEALLHASIINQGNTIPYIHARSKRTLRHNNHDRCGNMKTYIHDDRSSNDLGMYS